MRTRTSSPIRDGKYTKDICLLSIAFQVQRPMKPDENHIELDEIKQICSVESRKNLFGNCYRQLINNPTDNSECNIKTLKESRTTSTFYCGEATFHVSKLSKRNL